MVDKTANLIDPTTVTKRKNNNKTLITVIYVTIQIKLTYLKMEGNL